MLATGNRQYRITFPSQCCGKGVVRRAKLYYLRGRRGKSARIAERRDNKPSEAEA